MRSRRTVERRRIQNPPRSARTAAGGARDRHRRVAGRVVRARRRVGRGAPAASSNDSRPAGSPEARSSRCDGRPRFSGIGPLADDGWLLVPPGSPHAIAIGVAILRYRLYELDRLVSRTISYGLLTGALAAYASILVLRTYLVRDRGEHVSRRAVHPDRRCPPADPTVAPASSIADLTGRYDAERTTAEPAARLRAEVDLTRWLTSRLDRRQRWHPMVGLRLRPSQPLTRPAPAGLAAAAVACLPAASRFRHTPNTRPWI
jgi:hypothetical protein